MMMDLSVLYMVRRLLTHVKEEMVKRNMTFDEFLGFWDEAIERMEKESVTE